VEVFVDGCKEICDCTWIKVLNACFIIEIPCLGHFSSFILPYWTTRAAALFTRAPHQAQSAGCIFFSISLIRETELGKCFVYLYHSYRMYFETGYAFCTLFYILYTVLICKERIGESVVTMVTTDRDPAVCKVAIGRKRPRKRRRKRPRSRRQRQIIK